MRKISFLLLIISVTTMIITLVACAYVDETPVETTVLVKVSPTPIILPKFSFSTEEIEIFVEQEYSVEVIVDGKQVFPSTIVWETNDENIAVVQDGIIQGKASGRTTVTASYLDGSHREQIFVIVEHPDFQTLLFKNEYAPDLFIGEDYSLTWLEDMITYEPIGAPLHNLEWESSNESIISIVEGIITPLSKGVATITATTPNDIKAEIMIKCLGTAPESIDFGVDFVKIRVGRKHTLKARVLPRESEAKVSYSVQPSYLAEIDEKGVLTALNRGEGFIIASTANGVDELCYLYIEERSPVTVMNFRYKIDSVGGVEWTFKLRNNTDKEINYITLAWDCYNGVGDPITCQISRNNHVRIRYTGPLKAGKTTTRQKNMTRFYNSTYKKSSFTEIIIEFADGTSTTVDKYHFDIFS